MKKGALILMSASLALPALMMNVTAQDEQATEVIIEETVTITEEQSENWATTTAAETQWVETSVSGQPMPDIPPKKLKELRKAVWGFFDNLEYTWEEPSYTYVDSPETITVEGEVVEYVSDGSDLGFFAEPSSSVTSSQTVVETWRPSSSSTSYISAGGRAHWDEQAGRVVYQDGLTIEEKLAELAYLYRMSEITPGQYHEARATLNN